MNFLLDEISKLSGLPIEMINGGFRLINFCNRAVYIEGYTALIDVNISEVAVKLKKGLVKLNGDDLKIKNMTLDTLLVTGDIRQVEMG